MARDPVAKSALVEICGMNEGTKFSKIIRHFPLSFESFDEKPSKRNQHAQKNCIACDFMAVKKPGEADSSRDTKNQAAHGKELIFIENGYGFAIAWIAVSNGIKAVAVLSDASHHDHPMSFAMDFLSKPVLIGDAKIIFSNHCLKDGVKDWGGFLEKLMT